MALNNTVKNIIRVCAAVFLVVFIILRAGEAAQGIRASLSVCAMTIIPSMLPMLVITSYISFSGMLEKTERYFEKISRFLFRLPGKSLVIFIMSMTGGFPVGLKMTADALERGELSRNQAQRMSVFCIGGGPAFIINTVGFFMAGSQKAGIIILVSNIISSLITGIASRAFDSGDNLSEFNASQKNIKNPLINSVESAIKTIINICGWIIIFNAFESAVLSFEMPQKAEIWLKMLAEVTTGCAAAVKTYPLPLTAFVTGFCGLCVHCQVLPFLNKTGLPYRIFISVRSLNAAMAAAISHFLFSLFHCEISVFSFSGSITPVAWSVSFPASAAFLMTLSIIILDLAQKEKV